MTCRSQALGSGSPSTATEPGLMDHLRGFGVEVIRWIADSKDVRCREVLARSCGRAGWSGSAQLRWASRAQPMAADRHRQECTEKRLHLTTAFTLTSPGVTPHSLDGMSDPVAVMGLRAGASLTRLLPSESASCAAGMIFPKMRVVCDAIEPRGRAAR